MLLLLLLCCESWLLADADAAAAAVGWQTSAKTCYDCTYGADAAAVLCGLAACGGEGKGSFAVYFHPTMLQRRCNLHASTVPVTGGAYEMQYLNLGCDKRQT